MLAASLAACGAGALLIPARGEEAEALQRQASEQGIAWAALADPRRRPRPPQKAVSSGGVPLAHRASYSK